MINMPKFAGFLEFTCFYLFAASSAFALNWHIDKARLIDDGGKLEITLVSELVQHNAVDAYPLSATVIMSKEAGFIRYKSQGDYAKELVIDASNKTEVASLQAIINASNAWLASLRKLDAVHYGGTPDHHQSELVFHGTQGDFKIQFYNIKYLNGIVETIIMSSPSIRSVEIHPDGLEYALSHIAEFQKLHAETLKGKQDGMVEQARKQRQEATEELAAERVASEQRLQAYKAAKEAELRRIQTRKEVDKLNAEEEQAKRQMDTEFARKQVQRVVAYKTSHEGKALWEKIEKLDADTQARAADETAYLHKAVQTLTQTMSQHPPRNEAERRAFDESLLDLVKAQNAHRDSEKLTNMKTELRAALNEFEKALGISYKEAVEIETEAKADILQGGSN